MARLERALAVTGVGATTAVGLDIVTSAASVRAGLSRSTLVPGTEVLNEETHQMTPVTGHAVQGLTDGFALFGRWMQLARSAVEDLLRSLPAQAASQPGYWQRSVLLLVTRTPDENVFLDDPASTIRTTIELLGLALLEDLGLPISPQRIEVIPLGHLAGAAALRRAAGRLGVDCDRALIVAVDALLDPTVLEELASRRRLKELGNAAGLIPGEAAAALLIEAADRAAPAAILADVRGISVLEVEPTDDDEPVQIGSLSLSFDQALDEAGLPELVGDIYLDLNGEAWRAHQWGTALLDIQHRFVGSVQTPASSVGDVGAAMSLLAVCLACRSFARGYARGETAAILTTGEAGDSSCIVLGMPGMRSDR